MTQVNDGTRVVTEQAGGTLRIRSEPGQGTEVTFLLPAATQRKGDET